ncbi:MAG: hypothetical protein ABIP95_00810 [Pelobium sp.]
MSTRDIILLKFIGLFILMAYFVTNAWVVFLFLLGEVYAPFENNIISFNLMVMLFGVSVIFLTIYWAKGKTFMQILAQDIIIVVLAAPLFSALLELLKIGVDKNPLIAICGILIFTIALMTYNDWRKIKSLREIIPRKEK